MFNSSFMKSARYVFVGDRFPVLNRMIALGLDIVGVYCARDFFHGEPLAHPNLTVNTITDKSSLIDELSRPSFDVLVSNGCPYILPVSQMKTAEQIFINIHASLLPDFPGPHPVNAAMLAGKDGGATCHHMHDKVDSGEIITQVPVVNTPDMDLGLLYMLTLWAEADAFEAALARDFRADEQYTNQAKPDSYFKITPEQMQIDFSKTAEEMCRHIRAFGILSQGARFTYNGHEFKVFDAELCANPYLCMKAEGYQENQIIFIYDGTMVIRKGNAFLKLKNVQTDCPSVSVGDILSNKFSSV